MPLKIIYEVFMETLGKESPSYRKVKQWKAEFKRGRSLRMIDSLAAPQIPPLMIISRSCTPRLYICDRR